MEDQACQWACWQENYNSIRLTSPYPVLGCASEILVQSQFLSTLWQCEFQSTPTHLSLWLSDQIGFIHDIKNQKDFWSHCVGLRNALISLLLFHWCRSIKPDDARAPILTFTCTAILDCYVQLWLGGCLLSHGYSTHPLAVQVSCFKPKARSRNSLLCAQSKFMQTI